MIVTLLLGFLGAAALSDIVRHRIPNALSVAVAITALVLRATTNGYAAVLSGLAAGLVVGVTLFPAWKVRAVGGGDLKLGAAAACWVGLSGLPMFALASAIAAGVAAVCCYVASSRAVRRDIHANVVLLAYGVATPAPVGAVQGRVPVPAGAALAVGATVAMLLGG